MKKILLLGLILTFFLSLTVYTITLPPSITFGDSGEFVTAAYFLGIPHPPGAPFWVILAHLFTYIPFGSVAWRVNFSSAVFGALTVTTLFFLLIKIRKPTGKLTLPIVILLAISPLIFAYSNSFWNQSIIAKYFTLNTLLFGLLLITIQQFSETKKIRYFHLFFLLAGFNIATHYLSFLVLPILIFWILLIHWRLLWRQKSAFLYAVLFFIIGLSIFLYLPIRARANPPINWGNPSTPQTFIAHMTRKQFQRSAIAAQTSLEVFVPIANFSGEKLFPRFIETAKAFFIALYYEFPPYIIIVALLGIFTLIKYSNTRKWLLLTAMLFLFSGWGFAFLTNVTVSQSSARHAEYLYAFMIFTVWVGCGFAFLEETISKKISPKLMYLLVAFVITIPMYELLLHFQSNNWSRNSVAYDHAYNILKTLDPNSILIADKNNWLFPLLYLSKVERMRPDVTIYDRTGNLFEKIYIFNSATVQSSDQLETARVQVEKNLIKEFPNRPIYYAADKNFENYPHEVTQEGILYKDNRFNPKGISFEKEYNNILRVGKNSYNDFDTAYMTSYYYFRYADQLLTNHDVNQAIQKLEKAKEIGSDNSLVLTNVATYFGELGKIDEAIDIYQNIIAQNSANDVVRYNLALLLEGKDRKEEAISEYKKVLELNPKHLQAMYHLTLLLEQNKKYKEALDLYMRLENMNFENNYTIGKITTVAIYAGECQVAEMFYKKLDVTTNFKVIANNIGICWAQKKEYDKAKIWWEKSLEIDQNYIEPKNNLKQLQEIPQSLISQ